MIVCVCKRVSDREIARHAHVGLSFDDIQMELGIATQCGRCEDCARSVVAQCCTGSPVGALARAGHACSPSHSALSVLAA